MEGTTNKELIRRHAFDLEIFQRFLEVLRSDLPREQRDYEINNLRFALAFVSPAPCALAGPTGADVGKRANSSHHPP